MTGQPDGTVRRRTLDALRDGLRAGVKTRYRALEHRLKARVLGRRLVHLHGPQALDYGPEELLAICVVRNGALHIGDFLEHHLALGVRHIVLLDNGSTDATVALARRFEPVTILRTDCPYQRYENVMKRYLAQRFSRNRWNLCVDVDERFDYPFSDAIDLPQLLRYLNEHRYTAVVAQMLDLFPDLRLAELDRQPAEEYRRTHTFYDLSAIRSTEYRYASPTNPDIRMHWGGIRRMLFGTDNGLTKAPLVRVDPEADLFVHFHHALNVKLADFSAVLLHYPFAGSFVQKVAEAVQSGRYGRITGGEYARYWQGLRSNPELRFRGPAARRFTGVDPLIREGFLAVSPEYRRRAELERPPHTLPR